MDFIIAGQEEYHSGPIPVAKRKRNEDNRDDH